MSPFWPYAVSQLHFDGEAGTYTVGSAAGLKRVDVLVVIAHCSSHQLGPLLFLEEYLQHSVSLSAQSPLGMVVLKQPVHPRACQAHALMYVRYKAKVGDDALMKQFGISPVSMPPAPPTVSEGVTSPPGNSPTSDWAAAKPAVAARNTAAAGSFILVSNKLKSNGSEKEVAVLVQNKRKASAECHSDTERRREWQCMHRVATLLSLEFIEVHVGSRSSISEDGYDLRGTPACDTLRPILGPAPGGLDARAAAWA